MSRPILYGAGYSVYVRIARLTLIEKEIGHELVEVNVFAESETPADYLARHPFGRIPAFQHANEQVSERVDRCMV